MTASKKLKHTISAVVSNQKRPAYQLNAVDYVSQDRNDNASPAVIHSVGRKRHYRFRPERVRFRAWHRLR